jgi:hypothetical protein
LKIGFPYEWEKIISDKSNIREIKFFFKKQNGSIRLLDFCSKFVYDKTIPGWNYLSSINTPSLMLIEYGMIIWLKKIKIGVQRELRSTL